jgi:hypothetical protein
MISSTAAVVVWWFTVNNVDCKLNGKTMQAIFFELCPHT